MGEEKSTPLLRRLRPRIVYVKQADLAGEIRVERKQGGKRPVVGDVEKVVCKPDGELESL